MLASLSVGAPLAPPLELSAAFNPKPVHVQLRELAAFAESEDELLIQDAYGQGCPDSLAARQVLGSVWLAIPNL